MKIQTRLKFNTFISLGTVTLILLALAWSFRAIVITDGEMELIDIMRQIAFERILLRDEYLLYQEERAKTQWLRKSETLRDLLTQAELRFHQKRDQELLQDAHKEFNATFSGFSLVLEGHARRDQGINNFSRFSEADLRLISQVFMNAYALNDNLTRLHESSEKAIATARFQGSFVVFFSFLIGTVTLIINSTIIGKTITKRIASLTQGVANIGSGNLDYRIAVEGKDELATLAGLSNTMAAQLQRTFISIAHLEEEIERRKHTEEALRKTSDYLDKLIDYANAPIIVWDPQSHITRFNHAFELLTGRKEEEVIGLSPAILFPADQVEASMERIRSALSDERWDSVEIDIQHANASVRTVLWSSATIFTADGMTPLATIAQGQDITGRKQIEARLELTIQDLQRSNKELEQFAYVASHDLQEPLRMVTSYTQLLAERYENQLDDKAQKFIHYAVDGAVRMQQLINDLLLYSRVGTRGKPMEPTDALAALGEALHFLGKSIDEAKAIITNDELPEVRADASQLVQLFQNLIGNAVKFRGAQYPHIHITARDEGHEWLFSVKDNGIGIDPQYADKIFVIFQRLHARDEYPGSGIGLAICKKIVERHGGRIWFESEVGTGTTFYFTLLK